jgi:hypothetical protein
MKIEKQKTAIWPARLQAANSWSRGPWSLVIPHRGRSLVLGHWTLHIGHCHLLIHALTEFRLADRAADHLEVARQRLQQTERKLAFEERRVKAMEERLAALRKEFQPPRSKGGITPETLARIQEALKIL